MGWYPNPNHKRPGRPRDPQKDQDALAAARELPAEVGYQGTTVAAVARRAGIGAPTIYLADGTLLRAVTLRMVDAAEFCERTADALAALVHSSWQSDAADRHS